MKKKNRARSKAAAIMGSARTKKKAKSSRRNGLLGGRPKKVIKIKNHQEGINLAHKLAQDALNRPDETV